MMKTLLLALVLSACRVQCGGGQPPQPMPPAQPVGACLDATSHLGAECREDLLQACTSIQNAGWLVPPLGCYAAANDCDTANHCPVKAKPGQSVPSL